MPQEGDEVAQRHARGASRIQTLGKYRIIAELARGGMGVVYLALMRGPGAFDKLLVVKELRPELLDDSSALAMFMAEARLAARLSHPNVVQTIEAGADKNRRYIVMEYLDGQSLHRIIARANKCNLPVPFELQSAVLCSALEGLAYAHTARDYDGRPLGIVHRDVSPHNILVGYDGHVKVVDFGIAKANGALVDTGAGLLKGRVAYMAPEHAAGSVIDARADLFSIGVTLFEAATGRRFWSGVGNEIQALQSLLDGDTSVRAREMADVHGDLRDIVLKATAFDPHQRHESALKLLEELRAALAKRRSPPFRPAEIGRYVRGLFAEDRDRLQLAINDALRSGGGSSLDESPGGSDMPVAMQSFSTGSSPPRSAASASGNQATAQRRLLGWLLAAGAAISFGAVALAERKALRRSTAPLSTALSLPSSAVAPTALGSAATTEQPPPEKVHVIVRASPPAARIVIDQDLTFENPCVATFPRDGASHTVHVEAAGFVARDDRFDAQRDVTLVIELEPRKILGRPSPVGRPATAPMPAPPLATTNQPSMPESPPPAAVQTVFVPQRRINPVNPYNH